MYALPRGGAIVAAIAFVLVPAGAVACGGASDDVGRTGPSGEAGPEGAAEAGSPDAADAGDAAEAADGAGADAAACVGLGECECWKQAGPCRAITESCWCPDVCGAGPCACGGGKFWGCVPAATTCPTSVDCKPPKTIKGPDAMGCYACP